MEKWSKLIPRFKLEEKIHINSSNELYMAKKNNKFYFVKVYDLYESKKQYINELNVLKKVQGNLLFIQLHSFYENKDFGILILEWCEEGDLFTYVQNHLEQIDHFIFSLAQFLYTALVKLHTWGYAHGDIKMENILIRADGSYCLADFGHSFVVPYNCNEMLGTLELVPPEFLKIARGDAQMIDTKVDTWMMGMTLYEIINHGSPFKDWGLKKMVKELPKYTFKFDHEFFQTYPQMTRFIQTCLIKNSNKRPLLKSIPKLYLDNKI